MFPQLSKLRRFTLGFVDITISFSKIRLWHCYDKYQIKFIKKSSSEWIFLSPQNKPSTPTSTHTHTHTPQIKISTPHVTGVQKQFRISTHLTSHPHPKTLENGTTRSTIDIVQRKKLDILKGCCRLHIHLVS